MRRYQFVAVLLSLAAAIALTCQAAPAEGDAAVVEAREALRRGDRARLQALRQVVLQSGHPLAGWVDYWELSSRLPQATAEEVDAFYGRWGGSYVEDRLRNDWLLELGRRRDWSAFARDLPRFRMNDDREVRCYAQLVELQAGRVAREAALQAWQAQRDGDDGCQLLAQAMRDAGVLGTHDIWAQLRGATEAGRQRSARHAAMLLGADVARAVELLFDSPARFLTRQPPGSAQAAMLSALAAVRMANNDPAAAAHQLESPWARTLKPDAAAAAWGAVARQAALRQAPEAAAYAERALQWLGRHSGPGEGRPLSDDTLEIGRASCRERVS
jgi:soluble lytic murein transglycosylase